VTVYRAFPGTQDTDLNWTLISISTDGFTAPLKLIWSYKYREDFLFLNAGLLMCNLYIVKYQFLNTQF